MYHIYSLVSTLCWRMVDNLSTFQLEEMLRFYRFEMSRISRKFHQSFSKVRNSCGIRRKTYRLFKSSKRVSYIQIRVWRESQNQVLHKTETCGNVMFLTQENLT